MNHNYVAVPFLSDDGHIRITYQPFVPAQRWPSNPAKSPSVVEIIPNGYNTIKEMIQTFESRLGIEDNGFGTSQRQTRVQGAGDVQDTVDFIASHFSHLSEALLSYLASFSEDAYPFPSQNYEDSQDVDFPVLLHDYSVAKSAMRYYLREQVTSETSDTLVLQEFDWWVTNLLQKFLQDASGEKYTPLISEIDLLIPAPPGSQNLSLQCVKQILDGCAYYSMETQAGLQGVEKLMKLQKVLNDDFSSMISNSLVDSMNRLVRTVCKNTIRDVEVCGVAVD